MDEPTCPTCRTDYYLKFSNYTPGYTDYLEIPAHGGTIRKPRHEHPVVEFFCQRCGHFNGHSVAYDWQPPVETATEEELQALGEWWISPNQRRRVMPGGGIATIVGAGR